MRGDLKIYLKRLLTTVRNVETEAVAQTFERTFVFALSREATPGGTFPECLTGFGRASNFLKYE